MKGSVKRSIDLANWDEGLVAVGLVELGEESLDLVTEGRGMNLLETGRNGGSGEVAEGWVGESSLSRGLGSVHLLGDLGAVTLLRDELLLGL